MPRILLLLPRTTYRAEDFLEAAERLELKVTIGVEDQDQHGSSGDRLTLNFRDAEDCVKTAIRYATDCPVQGCLVLTTALPFWPPS